LYLRASVRRATRAQHREWPTDPLSNCNGEFQAFGHEVTITCFDWQFDSVVFFPATIEIGRNVLGRQGWLQKFRVALIDYDSVLHLRHYDE
jgi:hypothetical protein